MQTSSWIPAVIMYAPLFLNIVFLIATIILFAKVRSLATGLFFSGVLIATLAPWGALLLSEANLTRHADNIRMYVSVFGFFIQTVGVLFYSLSVPKRNRSA